MVTCNDNFVTNDPLHVWFCKTIEITNVLSILKISLPQIVRIDTSSICGSSLSRCDSSLLVVVDSLPMSSRPVRNYKIIL